LIACDRTEEEATKKRESKFSTESVYVRWVSLKKQIQILGFFKMDEVIKSLRIMKYKVELSKVP